MLVVGKISQAAVVAASAYKDQAGFQRQTGITKSCLIDDKLHRNTKVLLCLTLVLLCLTLVLLLLLLLRCMGLKTIAPLLGSCAVVDKLHINIKVLLLFKAVCR